MCRNFIFLLNLLLSFKAEAALWQVGPSRTYTKPSEVASLVSDGDVVEIDAGLYAADVAIWRANNITLRGVGGMAHLRADGAYAEQKAIWVIKGDNAVVEYIEFSLCKVPDNNGAGIRQEGTNLTVRHCYFHHNEMGILAGNDSESHILVEFTEFGWNGYGDGYSHNIYVNHIGKFTFRHNYSHHSVVGHLVKSRAAENYILYNRLSSENDGNVSREIDLPNGGLVFIIGNIIKQPANGKNSNIIGYGLEGLTNAGAHEVYAINNTIVNEKSVGNFFQFQSGTELFKAYNNILAGGGQWYAGSQEPLILDTVANLRLLDIVDAGFEDAANLDYHLTENSPAINAGVAPGSAHGFSLTPEWEYLHTASANPRIQVDALDIGAHESDMMTSDVEKVENEKKCPGYITSIGENFIKMEIMEPEVMVRLLDMQGKLLNKYWLPAGKNSIILPPTLPQMSVLLFHGKKRQACVEKVIFY